MAMASNSLTKWAVICIATVISSVMICELFAGTTNYLLKPNVPDHVQSIPGAKVQYRFVHIPRSLFGTFSEEDLERVITDNTSKGWELVQVEEGLAVVIFRKT